MPPDLEVGGMRKRHDDKNRHDAVKASHGSSPIGAHVQDGHSSLRTVPRRLWLGLVCLSVVSLIVFAYQRLSRLWFLRLVTLLPVALSLYTGVHPKRSVEQRIIPMALVFTVIAAQLPFYIATALAFICVTAFSIVTIPNPATEAMRRRKAQGTASFTTVVWAVLTMIAVLLTENFLIWVVSATFTDGQNVRTAPPPLQDNGQRVLKHVVADLTRHQVVGLRRLWNTQWALVACLGASFVVVELYHPSRTLYSLGTHAVLTVAAARSIRTISFLMTVLPSQVRNCYAQRFPYPPPEDTWEWLWVGMLPRAHGGCNDLIISGHAVITSTLACVSSSVATDPIFSVSLWAMLVLDYFVEIYEGFHYSVDMWLGIVLTTLLWRVLAPVEHSVPLLENNDDVYHATASRPGWQTSVWTKQNIIRFAPPPIIAYLQLVILPQWTSNPIILCYVGVLLFTYFFYVWKEKSESRKQPYMHYMQHVYLSLLVMALGIYL